MFVNPAGILAAFSLFLISTEHSTVAQLGAMFAVLSLLFFVGFAFLAYAVRYRINKQQITHPSLISVKCLYTSVASLLFLMLQILCFVISFILYYILSLPAPIYTQPGLWVNLAVASLTMVSIIVVWWYHVKLSDISPQRPKLDRVATLRGGYISDPQVLRDTVSSDDTQEEL